MTIGTLDGANVEIREEVGAENFFLFGLTADEAVKRVAAGYRPWEIYQQNQELKEGIDLISRGLFSHGDPSLFRPLLEHLLNHDTFLLLADYASYVDCQRKGSEIYQDPTQWTRMSILNVARLGKCSSDRTIAEYNRDVWHVKPVSIDLQGAD